MLPISFVLRTTGDGYWSTKSRAVSITGISLGYINDEQDFAELRVHFNTKTWDVNKHGLVYTDSQFIAELRDMLTLMGIDSSDVSYSEQGMQGRDYVSCDVGLAFLTSFKAAFPQEFELAVA